MNELLISWLMNLKSNNLLIYAKIKWLCSV
jgi:hypothetical protein